MAGLHLLSPWGLALLAGAAPLVVLYILRIRRRRQRVSSTWLWTGSQRDLMAKQPFRKLVPEIPLLLELLALAALALALARPSARGGSIDGDHVAVVIDASASMATRVGGPNGAATRLDEAKRAAGDVVARLAPGADAVVIVAARDARVVAPPDRDPRRLETAIAGIQALDVEGDLDGAVALAADRLRSLGGRQRLVVITDGALAHDEPLAVSGVPTEIVGVGDDEDNAGIVRIDVRSGLDATSRREQVQVFTLLRSWSARPRDAYVTLRLEGRTELVASRRLLLPAEDKVPVVLTFEPRAEDQGAGLVVQMTPGDAEPVDDVAYGRVPVSLRMPVALASDRTTSWTSRALEADPTVDLQRLTTMQLATVNVDVDALMVVEGACPDRLPGTDALVIAPPAGSCLGVDVGPTVEDPPVTSWAEADPRLRFLTLDGVHVARSLRLDARGAGGSLVRSSSTTLVADASSPGRTATVVGFDPGDSDWPLKASFVLFVRNVVELARLHRAQGAAGPVRTGDPARVAVPAGTKSVLAVGPDMPEHDVSARDGFAILPSLDRAGLYHVRWSEPHLGDVLLAANLTSALESDIRRRPVAITGTEASVASGVGHAVDVQEPWVRWLALLAALALALDVTWITRETRARRVEVRT